MMKVLMMKSKKVSILICGLMAMLFYLGVCATYVVGNVKNSISSKPVGNDEKYIAR